MKKQVKKLKLAKETLRSIEEVALEKVAGGYSIKYCDTWRYCPNEPNISIEVC